MQCSHKNVHPVLDGGVVCRDSRSKQAPCSVVGHKHLLEEDGPDLEHIAKTKKRALGQGTAPCSASFAELNQSCLSSGPNRTPRGMSDTNRSSFSNLSVYCSRVQLFAKARLRQTQLPISKPQVADCCNARSLRV